MAETTADVVRVIFEAGGHQEVSRAFETIEARMARFERASVSSAGAGVRARVNAAKQERKEKESIYAGLFKEIDAKEKAALKSADAAAKSKAKAEASAARDRLRVEEELARGQQRIRDNSARQAGRIAEQQATSEIRSAERSARERTRIADRAARDITERNKKIGGGIAGTIGSSTSRVLGGVGMLAGTALAIGGGASFADSIRDELGAGKAAAILSNSAFIRGAEGASGIRVSPEALLAKAKGIQAATGIDKGQVLAGMQSYVAKTGSAEILGANDSMVLDAAKLAKATGSDFGNVMGAVGILRSQNVNLGTEAGSQMLRDLVAQGKKGSVEMSDLASIAGRVTASSAMYSGSQTDAQRKLLGLSQIAIKTAGSPEEAATAISRLGSDTLAHGTGLRAAGLNLSDKKTGLLASPEQILSQVLGAAGGNLGKVQAMGYGERSIKLFEALAPTYQSAYAAAKGTEKERTAAAMAAVSSEVTGFTAAKFSKEDVANDLSVVMDSKSEKIDMAMMRLKEILADKGVPVFEKFINTLSEHQGDVERVVSGLVALADFLATNPISGIGAMVGVSIMKDLAGAGIGVVVKDTLMSILSKGTSGGNPMTITGAVTMAAGVVTIMAAKQAIDETLEGQVGGQRRVGELRSEISHLNELPPEQRKKKLAEIQGELERAEKTGGLGISKFMSPGSIAIDTVATAVTGDKHGITGANEKLEKGAFSQELINNMGRFNELIAKANKEFGQGGSGSSQGPIGMADPHNPSRNQTHAAPRVAQ